MSTEQKPNYFKFKNIYFAKDMGNPVKIMPQIPNKMVTISNRKFNKKNIINHGWIFVKFFQLLVGLQKILYTTGNAGILPEPCMKNDENLYIS